ncbi:MAG TPA: hypothetical protein VKD22_17940, partial [Ramlibacter sp.]|nr:hypothetical protein [Ramlibacter sp.]
ARRLRSAQPANEIRNRFDPANQALRAVTKEARATARYPGMKWRAATDRTGQARKQYTTVVKRAA